MTHYTKVEYDRTFFGGDYSKIGDFALISHNLIEDCGDVETAFEKEMGLPRDNIIHYCEDYVYDDYGDLVNLGD